MPKVGNKRYAYTGAGIAAAQKEAAATGQPLKKKKPSLATTMRGASYGKTS